MSIQWRVSVHGTIRSACLTLWSQPAMSVSGIFMCWCVPHVLLQCKQSDVCWALELFIPNYYMELFSHMLSIYSRDRATLELLEHRYLFCDCCLIKCGNNKKKILSRISPTVVKIISLVCRWVLTCLQCICKPVVWQKTKASFTVWKSE